MVPCLIFSRLFLTMPTSLQPSCYFCTEHAILYETLRERGTDLNVLLKWGLPRFVDLSDSLSYVFAAPQIPAEQTWVDRADDVLALLDELIASQPIDPARVILAGFSLGSAGIWHIAALHPDRFAGLVPVSGRVPKTLY